MATRDTNVIEYAKAAMASSLLFASLANAAGYYNLSAHWKGALNPYQLGGVNSLQSGFTSGLGLSTSNAASGGLDSPKYVAFDAAGNIYVADNGNARINKYNSSGVFLSSIPAPGYPNSVSFDSSGNMYVTDAQGDGDVSKYDSSGNLIGWIGEIGTSPTGGAAGCNGAAVGTFTPGWCTGGASSSGMGDGMMNGPSHVAFDASGNLYVSDWGNARINKYSSTGAFMGWIGNVLSSPTGGAAGCNGAAVGTFTPGWCTGGTSQGGTGDGMLANANDVALDSSGNIYAADGNGSRISKYNPTGAFLGWIGKIATSPTGGAAGCNGAAVGTFTPGWCTGGASGYGSGDGMIDDAGGMIMDSSGNIYVADVVNHRINKYSSSGTFLGWIGKIATSPTGGAAGCNGAAVGTFTPGWCTGGTSGSGTGDGMLSRPADVALDPSGNLFVADYDNHRVNKYTSAGVFVGAIQTVAAFSPIWRRGQVGARGNGDGMLNGPWGIAQDSAKNLYVSDGSNSRISKYNSSGTFLGWIGKIATSPTGGAAGCSGAAVGTFTPGWCTGGTSASGTGNGMLDTPTGIVLDSSGNLYVVDSNNARINKYDSSGVFQGWIGKIATSPTGGAAGCSGAAVGTNTPGWCTGGTSASGTGNGMLNAPNGIALDSSSNLYAMDSGNHRINKYNSSGVFQGWIGKIATSPTGGATGCNGASVGTFTPGWCTGGTSAQGTGDGMLKSPSGIALDTSGNLYVADTFNSRISKYDSSGVFQGWIGSIDTSPTGGAVGCSGAARYSFTPGWCKGGASTGDDGDGELQFPNALVLDSSGNFYVADSSNHRINKYKSTGATLGWLGTISTSPTGGATGCKGAAVGTFTPGWCTGGAANDGLGDGTLAGTTALTLDSSGNFYVVDRGNNRIIRISNQGK